MPFPATRLTGLNAFTSFTAIAVLTLLAACASDAPRPDPPTNPGLVKISKDWDTYVGFGPSYRDYRYRPAQDDAWVYIAGKQGELYRVDKLNGNRETLAVFDREITGGVTLVRGSLLFGNIDGELIAFSLDERKAHWSVSLGSEVLHPPVSNGALVAVKTNNGQLWGVELATGTILWTTITNNPPLSTRAKSAPLLAAGLVFSSFDTGKVAIINPRNGARMWEAAIGETPSRNEIQRIIDADTSPVLNPPYLYAANLHGSLRAFKLAANQLPESAWSRDFSTHLNLALDARHIYAISEQSSLHAFAKDSGEEAWSNTSLKHQGMGAPLLWRDYLISAATDGRVYVFNPDNGALLGVRRVSPYAVSSFLLADKERLFVQDDGGYLHALRIDDHSSEGA